METGGDGFSVGYFAVYAVAFAASILGSVFVTRIQLGAVRWFRDRR